MWRVHSSILVGDVDQLPSVRPGLVLANMIEAASLKTVRLRERLQG